jgi:hypothetical protein
MSVAWVAVGASVVGGIMQNDTQQGAIDAQSQAAQASQAASDRALDAQIRQGDELIAFNKQVYDEGKARQSDIDAINKQVVTQNLAMSQKAGERADEAYDFYKTNGRPVIEKALNDANTFDSQGNIDAARGRASGDVAQAYDAAQEQSQRALTRMGVNPSSGRFLALQNRLAADKAANMAGAQTNAEQGIRDQAIGMRQQGSNLAMGMPAQSTAQAGQGSGMGVAAAGVAGQGGAQNAALGATAIQGMAQGAGIYGSAAGGYANLANGANYAAGQIGNQAAAAQAGWGNLAGIGLSKGMQSGLPSFNFGGGTASPNAFGGANSGGFGTGSGFGNQDMGAYFSEGGPVSGPGTGTSDSVPAHLSNGEFVIPADVVRAKGTEFFQRLVASNHKSNLRSAA